jgi:hypothetical protein
MQHALYSTFNMIQVPGATITANSQQHPHYYIVLCTVRSMVLSTVQVPRYREGTGHFSLASTSLCPVLYYAVKYCIVWRASGQWQPPPLPIQVRSRGTVPNGYLYCVRNRQ